MKKSFKSLPLLFTISFCLTSCSFFRAQKQQAQDDNKYYEYSKDTYWRDDQGQEYYLSFELDEISLVDEQTVELKVLRIDRNTLKPIDYFDYSFRKSITFAFRDDKDNGVVSFQDKGVLLGRKEGVVDVELRDSDGGKIDAIKVNVSKKALESIEVKGYSKEFLVGKQPQIKYSLIAHFSNQYSKELKSTDYGVSIDKSRINYHVVGDYPVNVSYYYRGVNKTTSFNISIVEELSVKYERMNFSYKELDANSAGHWRSSPSEGNLKWLVIPVWFTDTGTRFITPDHKEDIKEDLNTAFFGGKDDIGWHSVKSFYEEESMHRLTLNGVVSDWYECGVSSENIDQEGKLSSTKLANDAMNWYFANTGDNFSDYDIDNDNYIDGLVIIYGSRSKSDTSGVTNTTFWPKVTNMGTIVGPSHNPYASKFMWTSFDDLYGNEEQALARTGFNYFNGDTRYCSLDTHTIRHESGHMFGLNDLYDYGPNKYIPMGRFSLQENNVGSHDPWSTLALGWGEYYAPTDDITIEMVDSQTEHKYVILTPDMNLEGSPFDEYLIVDLYSPKGLNTLDTEHSWMDTYSKGKNVPGIRVYHIDARLLDRDEISIDALFTNPTQEGKDKVEIAMTNSYDEEGRITRLGSEYQNYKQVQLIRNNTESTYINNDYHDMFQDTGLFYQGDTFTMEKYGKQFVNTGKMNSNVSLGWEFTVDSIFSDGDTYYSSVSFKKV